MTDTDRRSNNSLLVVILASLVGIFALLAFLAMQSAPEISIAEQQVDDLYMESLEHAARRHGSIVYDVHSFCQEGGNNIQAKMSKQFEDGRRDARVCFFTDGNWWVDVMHEDGHVVTVFPRRNAKSLQDLI